MCEAEDAEEKELRAASNRKMAAAAEEDAVSLQLPDSVAQQVFFVSTGQDLDDAEQHLRQLVRQNGSCDDIFGMLATKGRALGLDAEWKPFLEKRLGLPWFAWVCLQKIELFAFSLHLYCMFLRLQSFTSLLLLRRGGMQKHRRSTEGVPMEPCSTLQVAADDFVLVFDLLALAPKKAVTSSRLSELLSPLFRDTGIIKLGFGLQ